METKIVMTGNLRAYRDILKKRHHVAADREIQALASEILRQLREIAPNSFMDIPEEPYV
jgi:thymidylate synthase (FAD)